MATAPRIPVARTIAPSDNSTSIVIEGSGPQIDSGRTPLTTYRDIVYDPPAGLKLDLQVPKTSGVKPLIVYITAGGFALVDNFLRRTTGYLT